MAERPRIWWDGNDFLCLVPRPYCTPEGRSTLPRIYRAETEQDILSSEAPVVELVEAAPPSAEAIDRASRVVINVLRSNAATQAGTTGLIPFERLPAGAQASWRSVGESVVRAVVAALSTPAEDGETEAPDEDELDLSSCPYYRDRNNGQCQTGCWSEPECVTGELIGGWPSVRGGGSDVR